MRASRGTHVWRRTAASEQSSFRRAEQTMAAPLFCVDLSEDARDYRQTALEPGLPLLDRQGRPLRHPAAWLGDYVAEPEWLNEQVVAFYWSTQQRGRSGRVACQPLTKAELERQFAGDLEAIRDRLRKAKAESSTARLVLQDAEEEPRRTDQRPEHRRLRFVFLQVPRRGRGLAAGVVLRLPTGRPGAAAGPDLAHARRRFPGGASAERRPDRPAERTRSTLGLGLALGGRAAAAAPRGIRLRDVADAGGRARQLVRSGRRPHRLPGRRSSLVVLRPRRHTLGRGPVARSANRRLRAAPHSGTRQERRAGRSRSAWAAGSPRRRSTCCRRHVPTPLRSNRPRP